MKAETETLKMPLGKVDRESGGPGCEYQIDAAVADIQLVDESRRFMLGRPTVYLVVDSFSEMIVGLHLTFDTPRFIEALAAIWNAFEEKVSYCRKLGIEIREADWPAKGVPQKIVADHGELFGKHSDALVATLNVQIKNMRRYVPVPKRLIERTFKILNGDPIQWLWHEVPEKRQKQGAEEFQPSTHFTLRDLTKALVLKVLEHNRTTQPGRQFCVEFVASGLQPTPINLWEWGLKNLTGMLRTVPPSHVRCMLLPRASANLTRRGIMLEGLVYLPNDSVVATRMFRAVTIQGSSNVAVRYDPVSVKEIYLLGDNSGEVEVCTLAEQNRRYAQLSWYEWQLVQNEARKLKRQVVQNEEPKL